MACKCNELAKLDDIPSKGMQAYASEHLIKVSVDAEAWEIVYQCPETGIKFLRKNIHSELHGGGMHVWSVIAGD
jgi:hypothetical protein